MNRFGREHVVVATVLHNLLNKHFAVDSPDEALVVGALRRSKTELSEASLTELGDYVAGMDADQLRGLASNVKGIYHELKFAAAANEGGRRRPSYSPKQIIPEPMSFSGMLRGTSFPPFS